MTGWYNGGSGIETIQNIQLPQVGNENLQYQFSYGTSSNLQLIQVNTPYGATISYAYGGPTGPVSTGDLDGLNSGVSLKTIGWTDPQGTARTQQWQLTASTYYALQPPQGNGGVVVIGPDGDPTPNTPNGKTEYDFCNYANGVQPAGASQICAIYYPNGDVTQNVWQQNCAWGDTGSGPDGGNQSAGNFFLQAEYRSLHSSQGYQTAVKTFGYNRNGNLLGQNEWDFSTTGTLPTPSGSGPGGTPARSTANAFYVTTGSLANGSNGVCSSPPDDANAYWNLGLGPVLNAKVASQVADSLGNKQLTQLAYDNPLTNANVTQELHWRSRDNDGNPVSYPSSPFAYPPTLTSTNAAITQHTYVSGVNYFFGLTTTISPAQRQLLLLAP